ncbi:hypothetical protein [Bartonella sp. DGB2]|uniref:hypothetical protein n=1 Tax=Bartonella sp. DGB2 TaxID=3388426 RepID=UPI00398FBD8C
MTESILFSIIGLSLSLCTWIFFISHRDIKLINQITIDIEQNSAILKEEEMTTEDLMKKFSEIERDILTVKRK